MRIEYDICRKEKKIVKMFFVHVCKKGLKKKIFCEIFLLSDDTKTGFIVVYIVFFLPAVL